MVLFIFCRPDGVERVSKMSGVPETSQVNAMLPAAMAVSGREEGAKVIESVSRMSTYSLGDRCLTLDRRQGRAGWDTEPREDMPCIGVDDSGFLHDIS